MTDLMMRVGEWAAERLDPLWRAWDWVTGRRTVDLAWLLLVITEVGRTSWDASRHNWVYATIDGVWTVIVGLQLRVISNEPRQRGEALSLRPSWCRDNLALFGGIHVLLSPLTLFGSRIEAAFQVGQILCLLAGVADYEGSGKSCLARGLDNVRGMIAGVSLRPALGAAG